ncbi:hypothetical protein QVD17_37455 [Tagetes erecta]|uniref:Uncharacterized protein n=1 Tax=Tagetes erecta TaxID=13708 RepID=A0AAD8NK14_TARER|nr:hypothetical protein QVD17_37455 [Tagetes erecta]
MGSLNRPQVSEIAIGLERSEYQFLWSLRQQGKTKLELPREYENIEDDLFADGFMDRTAHRGLCVGGRLSVTVATWPLYGEQHLNAFEMVKELGLSVGIRLGSDLVLADEVERIVMKLMNTGDGVLTKKVKEMSDKSKLALMQNSMGRRKRLLITSVVINEAIEDHVEDSLEDHLEDYFEDQEAFETQQDQTTNEQGAPKRGEMYITTRTHKDGSIVDDKAADVVVMLH